MPIFLYQFFVRQCIFLMLFFLLVLPCPAQQTFVWAHYGAEEGLEQSTVLSATQDRTGFLWFGTQDGVYRFDGHKFRAHKVSLRDTNSLLNNYVTTICADSSDNVWVGSSIGLSCFHARSGRWTRHQHLANDPKALSGNAVFALLTDRSGTVWCGTNAGLCRLDSVDNQQGISQQGISKWSRIMLNLPERSDGGNTIAAMALDRFSPYRLWCCTLAGTLIALDTKTGRQQNYRLPFADIPFLYRNFPLIRLLQDRLGAVWCATSHYGVFRLDIASAEWTHYSTNRPENALRLASNDIWTICEMPEYDEIWLGSYGNGIQRIPIERALPPQQSRSLSPIAMRLLRHHASDKFSISGNAVLMLFRDREGNLWSAINTVGLSMLSTHQLQGRLRVFRHIEGDATSLDDNAVETFVEDQRGNIWVSSGNSGVQRMNSRTGEFAQAVIPRTKANALKGSKADLLVRSMCRDSTGRIWLGTGSGLYVGTKTGASQEITFAAYAAIPHLSDAAFIRCLFCDSKGTVWAGTRGRLTAFSPEKGVLVDITDTLSGFRKGNVIAMQENPDGTLWIASWGGGLMLYNPQTRLFRSFPPRTVRRLPDSTALPNTAVISLCRTSNGNIWCGTLGGGLARLIDTANGGTFEQCNEENGLPNNVCFGILEEGTTGAVWVSTNKGLCRVGGQYGARQFTILNHYDGLPSDEFNEHTALRSRDGTLYFGGVGGFITLHPHNLRQLIAPHPGNVVLTGVRVAGLPLPLPNDAYSTSLIFNNTQTQLSFEFSALTFASARGVEYAVQMVGYDTTAISLGRKNEVTYSGLPFGDYVLRVWTLGNDGTKNGAPLEIAIAIVPAWWQTRWFLGSMILCGIVGMVALVRGITLGRERRKMERDEEVRRQREEERERIAKDVHDDVGATLTRITLLSEVLERQIEQPGLRERLVVIAAASREAALNLSDIIWAINPANDILPIFFAHLREYTTEFFDDSDIRCVVEMPQPIPTISLAPEVRRNLLLVAKEALNNVIKHSGARTVLLECAIINNELEISITDDGIGIPLNLATERLSGGNGLRNMQKRMEAIHGRLVVGRAENTAGGTKVRLVLEIA
jgi:signal transduction histidine kinase/ligand-binding sensor domain-containing protein